jgi:hypothetical protein
VTSAVQSITLRNAGKVLTTGSITAAIGFGQTNNCGASLTSGAGCTTAVTFGPFVNGTRAGSLIVVENAANGVQDAVSLSGAGTGEPVWPAALTP